MSNLVGKAKSSKLRESIQASDEVALKKEKVLRLNPFKGHPRSYRFDPEILNTLKDTLDKINEVSPKKVTEARLLKALIFLSREIKTEKIIQALKSVW